MGTKFQMAQLWLSDADTRQFRESAEFRARIVGDMVHQAERLLCSAQRSAVWAVHGHGEKLESGRVERLPVKCEVREALVGDFCFGVVRKHRTRKIIFQRAFKKSEADRALAWAQRTAKGAGHEVLY